MAGTNGMARFVILLMDQETGTSLIIHRTDLWRVLAGIAGRMEQWKYGV